MKDPICPQSWLPRQARFGSTSVITLAVIAAVAVGASAFALPCAGPSAACGRASRLAQAQAPVIGSAVGVGPGETGMIVGTNWIVEFSQMPWAAHPFLAERLEIQDLFAPDRRSLHRFAPVITVSFSPKMKGDSTPADNARLDLERQAARGGSVAVTPGPRIKGLKGTITRVFQYKGGYDEVAYTDGGPVLFVVALHCRSQAKCTHYGSLFAKFVPTLRYIGNVKVVRKH